MRRRSGERAVDERAVDERPRSMPPSTSAVDHDG
jgi:hypothetical protein